MKTGSTRKKFCFWVWLSVCVCVLNFSAQGELYVFGKIAGGKSPELCPVPFTMEVTEQSDQALFTFTNNCSSKGALTRLFFMKNDLMEYNSIDYDLTSEGVSFSKNKKKAMLPGGHSLGFTPHNTFSINAKPPRPKNGLHYGDYVSILFDLNEGVLFGDLIEAIDEQSLGIGLHAQGGKSGSFVVISEPIPEPATLVLFGLSTLTLRLRKSRR